MNTFRPSRRTRAERRAARQRAIQRAERTLRITFRHSPEMAAHIPYMARRRADNMQSCSCHLCTYPRKPEPVLALSQEDFE